MHTEKEALDLWCPFVRVFNEIHNDEVNEMAETPNPHPAHNRIVVDRESDAIAKSACDFGNLKCVASHCMAWRWDEERATDAVEAGREPLGFCGLAGKP